MTATLLLLFGIQLVTHCACGWMGVRLGYAKGNKDGRRSLQDLIATQERMNRQLQRAHHRALQVIQEQSDLLNRMEQRRRKHTEVIEAIEAHEVQQA